MWHIMETWGRGLGPGWPHAPDQDCRARGTKAPAHCRWKRSRDLRLGARDLARRGRLTQCQSMMSQSLARDRRDACARSALPARVPKWPCLKRIRTCASALQASGCIRWQRKCCMISGLALTRFAIGQVSDLRSCLTTARTRSCFLIQAVHWEWCASTRRSFQVSARP